MTLITGHNLIQPKPADAPLEFTQDAAILAKCQSAMDDLRRKNAAASLASELEAEDFTFVGGAA